VLLDLLFVEKPDLGLFVQNLILHYHMEGVKRKGHAFYYDVIGSPEELCLDFDCTLIPPRKYFTPPREVLLRYTSAPSKEVTPLFEKTPFILFGVHPYDIKAIKQMDQVFSEGIPEPHYLKRREAALIIGVYPRRIAPRAFWADMEADRVSEGFDLMLTDIEDGFTVEIGSERGEALLARHGKTRMATASEQQKTVIFQTVVSEICKENGLKVPKGEIPGLLERSNDSTVWEEKGGKCLSCGTCIMVCPTCYCFDVLDEVTLDLSTGERVRRWDGCMLEEFAKVASGENFRESKTSRYRHRFYKKGLYLFRRLDDIACVGCGRCSTGCLPDIADPADVFNRLHEGMREDRD
jgi:ferredoxin